MPASRICVAQLAPDALLVGQQERRRGSDLRQLLRRACGRPARLTVTPALAWPIRPATRTE
jgi:hypothetical protein